MSETYQLSYTAFEIDKKLSKVDILVQSVNGKADASHNHDNAYDIKGAAAESLASANAYTDEQVANLTTIGSIPKAGFIYPLASATVPEGFLLCDGAEYSRTDYPELFAAIGVIYGEGNGSTTFNVPNLETRVPIGVGEGYELGATGGEETHTLIPAETPTHSHSINIYTANGGSNGGGIVSYYGTAGGSKYGTTTSSSTRDQPHNNMQPYTVVNYIIATGKDTGVSVSDIVLGAQAIPLGVEYGGTGATDAINARNNLGITPDNIGALSMELLWENASPTSSFAAQTIDLDLGSFSKVFILFSTNSEIICDNMMCDVGKSLRCMSIYYNAIVFRGGSVTTTGIDFSDCSVNTTYSSTSTPREIKNTSLIPYKIYGVKGVSA